MTPWAERNRCARMRIYKDDFSGFDPRSACLQLEAHAMTYTAGAKLGPYEILCLQFSRKDDFALTVTVWRKNPQGSASNPAALSPGPIVPVRNR
jgi:hypothetical protein